VGSEKGGLLLDIRNLSVTFESYNRVLDKVAQQVIFDLSVEVCRGEILAIVGSSGSGKSLLAHAVMGILPSNAKVGGAMFYKGERLTQEVQAGLRGSEIALIPQSVAYLDPLMKIGDQVRGVRGDAVREAQERAFERYQLDLRVEKLYPFQLSGGMARRVLISTAIVADADLIVADEPTPGLDLEIAADALQDFRKFANQGKGVVLITHDIDLALSVADRISIFHGGTVVETAERSCFFGAGEGLRHPYSRALFQALPQNGFCLPCCLKCGASAATWEIVGDEMRCGCGEY